MLYQDGTHIPHMLSRFNVYAALTLRSLRGWSGPSRCQWNGERSSAVKMWLPEKLWEKNWKFVKIKAYIPLKDHRLKMLTKVCVELLWKEWNVWKMEQLEIWSWTKSLIISADRAYNISYISTIRIIWNKTRQQSLRNVIAAECFIPYSYIVRVFFFIN